MAFRLGIAAKGLRSACISAAGHPTVRLLATNPGQLLFLARRMASSGPYYAPKPTRPKGIKIGHLFAIFATAGLAATSIGLYQFYSAYTAYPNTTSHPIRSLLRKALRAAVTGDQVQSSKTFADAYALALDLASKGGLGTKEESLMKTTGIAVRWGGMWEEAGNPSSAREAYELAFAECERRVAEGGATHAEVVRGVGVALKIGDLWVDEGSAGDKEAEHYYVWAVTELMRLGMTDSQKEKVQEAMVHHSVPLKPQATSSLEEKPKSTDSWDLPNWLGKVELVATVERLGSLYGRLGKPEYAQPLLQQAIATLLPPPPKEGPRPSPPPIPARCHAATLMNNLSSSYVTAPSPNAAEIEQASRWARQALTVSVECRKEADRIRKGVNVPLSEREDQECEMVAAVASFNLGKLSELAGDKKSARAWFEKSSKQSLRIGMREGVLQSTEALRRLDR
ncbi:hypothetical protein T439DRAFT_348509 [Meredithblackwellia eburnea MCA 4105]